MTRPRGESGSTQTWAIPTELWLVRPSQETESQRRVAETLRTAASEQSGFGWEEVQGRAVKGHEGRRTDLLSPADLRKLYVRAHRAHVWVAATAGMQIRVDPSNASIQKKNLILLRDVVRHKVAGYTVVSRPEEADPLVAAVAAWAEEEQPALVDSHHDPRCLPMHAFSPNNRHDLSTPAGQQSFVRSHRKRSSRNRGTCLMDTAEREWQFDPTMHGADSLHLSGLHLPTGLHWDVQTPRRKRVFSNGWETWTTVNQVHLNVHPDGFVRSRAERTWAVDKDDLP